VADLGFLKEGFCSAEEFNLKVESKKDHQVLQSPFLSHQLYFLSFSHIISNKTTIIEYLDVAVLLESLDLT